MVHSGTKQLALIETDQYLQFLTSKIPTKITNADILNYIVCNAALHTSVYVNFIGHH